MHNKKNKLALVLFLLAISLTFNAFFLATNYENKIEIDEGYMMNENDILKKKQKKDYQSPTQPKQKYKTLHENKSLMEDIILNGITLKTNETKIQPTFKSKANIRTNKVQHNTFTSDQVSNFEIYNYEFRSPVIIEKYKLLWFLNPKAASASASELLAKMSGLKIISGETRHKDLQKFKRLRNYAPEQAAKILNDPNWTRVIILRDPKQRILSAYLDKEQKYHKYKKISEFKEICCSERSTRHIKNCNEYKFTFIEFIKITKKCKPKNYHWQGQYDEIDDWSIINYPINFNNLANDTERLLRKLGAWKKFGATGYGKNGTMAIFQENTRHSSGTDSKLKKYYTEELRKIVKRRFADDYTLLRRYFPDDYKWV